MKKIQILILLFLLPLAIFADDANPPTQLTVELRDGSRVVGKALEDTLSLHSAALGDLKLPWAGIRAIEYAADTGAARLTATNGDAFTVQLAGDTLSVQTGFGKTELPLKQIRSIKVAPARPNDATTAAAVETGSRLTIELRDGSHVVGKGLDDALNFHSTAMGDLKLAWSGIRSIEYPSTGGDAARLTATNGDVYEVQFVTSAVRVETSFGKSELPVKLIRSIMVSSAGGVRHALKFNLSNRVEIPNAAALQFGTLPFTISFWVKTASERPLVSFISKRANSLGDGWVVHQDHGQLLFYCAGCASPKSQPVSIRDDQWHHLAVTRSGSLMTFYLDGKNVGAGETRCNHYDNNPIRIGMDGAGDSWHFEGEISEVHIYGRALSGEEVTAEWNQAGTVADGGLIAGYHFDEGQGDAAKDFSGHHHDGALINNPEWEN